jgi:uncharacterized membrane protein
MDQPQSASAAARRIHVNTVGFSAPFRWLGQGWRDLWRAPGPCLAYGLVLAGFSAWISYALYRFNAAFWVLTLTLGFVFIAPMLAMGLYEAGRRIEAGERPRLRDMVLVRQAVRQDTFYLGLALLMIYLLWGRVAQIVYGLNTFTLQHTTAGFIDFALHSQGGHTMLIVGTGVGAVFALLTYALVVVSAPMLLDTRSNVFSASATSFRAMDRNTGSLLLWAILIVMLLLISAATGFAALTVVFPWLGLASWRAYRELVSLEG